MAIGIDAYLTELIADSAHRYTANELTIPAPLCQRFVTLVALSEANVVEHGCSLDWIGNTVTACIPTFVGPPSGTAVDLQTLTERHRAAYIGGFHTHPYVAKYGAGIGIGPSNGDWMEWWNRAPTGPTVAAQFVASGSDLFLMVFRRTPAGALAQNNVTSDTERLNQAVRNWSEEDIDAYGDAVAARQWATARTMLRQNSPTAITRHQADAHQMNCDLARANGVEYFKGTLNNGPSTLALASQRVLGNFITSTYWTHSTDPWFG
jgi:hypothetical protein